jgi:hypothetical protein
VFGFRIHTWTKRKWGRNSVVAAGDGGRAPDIAGKLGVEPGMVVQELGWDEDVDEAVRDAVEERCGDELLDEDADDVIAAICEAAMEPGGDNGNRAVIVSSDEDLFQCLNPFVDMWSPTRKTLVTEKSFIKEYGIEPVRWPGVKSL